MALRNRFRNDESGQDLFEYTLLMAFVTLATGAILIGIGMNVQGLWRNADSQLSAAVLHVPASAPSVGQPAVTTAGLSVDADAPGSRPMTASSTPSHSSPRRFLRAASQFAAAQFQMVSSWRISFSRGGRFVVSLSTP